MYDFIILLFSLYYISTVTTLYNFSFYHILVD